MYGPAKLGEWSGTDAPNHSTKHQFLVAGSRYRVIRAFEDYQRTLHPVGEEWVFLGDSFVPYEDGLTLFVSLDGVQEWGIPLQWRDEEQGPILESLADYVQPA